MKLFNRHRDEDGETVRKGTKVAFFQGRRPMKGIVEETQDDGRIVVAIQSDGGIVRIVKDEDEVKPYNEVSGKKAQIRFI